MPTMSFWYESEDWNSESAISFWKFNKRLNADGPISQTSSNLHRCGDCLSRSWSLMCWNELSGKHRWDKWLYQHVSGFVLKLNSFSLHSWQAVAECLVRWSQLTLKKYFWNDSQLRTRSLQGGLMWSEDNPVRLCRQSWIFMWVHLI